MACDGCVHELYASGKIQPFWLFRYLRYPHEVANNRMKGELAMEYRQLGRSGLRVSKLCLGTMVGFKHENQDSAGRVISEAIDLGVNFIDTADCYGESEEVVGKALKKDGRRDQIVLATKFCWYMGDGPNDYGASRYHIMNACEDSLRKLQTDHIDLYIIHVVDPNTPWDETLSALDTLVRQGKVRYIGTSKHPATLILEAIHVSERLGLERFVSEQPPYNLLDRRPENELIPTCLRHGVGITPFSPLAAGLLSGKYRLHQMPSEGRHARRKLGEDKIFTQGALEAVEKLIPIAERKGITLAELSLAWLMQQPGLTAAILGARNLDYLRSGVNACDVELTQDDLAEIDSIVPPGTHVSNYYETNVYRPFRMAFSSAARGGPGAGAFIPDHKTGSDKNAGRSV